MSERSEPPAGWQEPLGRTASRAAVAGLVIAGLLALWTARDLVFVVALGLLFGVGLAAPVDALERRRLPRWAGTLLALGALAGAIWLSSWWLGPRIAEQMRELQQRLPAAVERLESRVPFERLAEPGELQRTARDRLLEESGAVARRALRLLSSVVGVVAAALLVLAVAVWYAANPETYRRALVRLFPPGRREAARSAIDEVEITWRRWLVGQLVSMISIGALTMLALASLGVPAPLALGFLAGVSEFVPVFGPVITAIPAILLALLEGPRLALYVLGAYLVIQQIESNLVMPLVMRHAVAVPPLLTLVGGSLFALFGGFLGLLVAVPLLAAALAVFRVLNGEGTEGQ